MKNRLLSCLFTLVAGTIGTALSTASHATATCIWESGYPKLIPANNIGTIADVSLTAGGSYCTQVEFYCNGPTTQSIAIISTYTAPAGGGKGIGYGWAFTSLASGQYGVYGEASCFNSGGTAITPSPQTGTVQVTVP